MRRWDGWPAALALGALYFAILWMTAPAIGFVRDEGYYFKAAQMYFDWFAEFRSQGLNAFSDAVILRHFDYNHEHPPLVKLTQGAFHAVLHDLLGVSSNAQGFRAAGFFFGALALWGTYALGRELHGPQVGLLAAAFLGTMPRFFFDAHLATFDVPIAALWVWNLWAFHRAWTRPSRLHTLVAGLMFGLALATKLNAFFLPFVFVSIWLVDPPDRLWPRRVQGPSGTWDWVLPGLPVTLIAVGALGFAVFFASWPYLWHDPLERFGGYLRFHLGHEHYPVSYFGRLWVKPPFPVSFPWVMSALTIPSPVWVMGAWGLFSMVFRRWNRNSVLLMVGTLLPVALISLPNTPIFGGTKHWYNALPTLSIVAAQVGWQGWQSLRERVPVPAAVAVVLWLGPGVAGIWRVHPHGIGFYNALAGGVRGGAELGMQRAFWGGVVRPLLPELVREVDQGRVFYNRMNFDAFRMYREDGILPRDRLHYANSAKRTAAAFHFEQPEHAENEGQIWSVLGTRPVAGVYVDNVTMGQMYVKGRSDGPPDSTGSKGVRTSTGAAGIQ